MKKLLVLIPFLLVAAACGSKPKEPLSPTEASYNAKLTPELSTLTSDDSTEKVSVSIASNEDANVKYDMEIGNPCYLKTLSNGLKEIIVKPGAYIKSVSEYKVDRIIVDFFAGKGVNFGVYASADGSGDALEYHESSIAPVYPEDNGVVYEYAINGNAWCLKNNTEFNKPAFYSITVVFSK